MVCVTLELVGPWVVLGFNVGMEAFDELLLINVPWSQEFSGGKNCCTRHLLVMKRSEHQDLGQEGTGGLFYYLVQMQSGL